MIDASRLAAALRKVDRAPEIFRCFRSLNDWRTISLSYIGFRRLPLPYTLQFRDGTSFRLEEFYDLETLWQIYFRRVYPVDPADTCIVDLGANIGLFCSYAALSAPQSLVYSAEPLPATYERLVANIGQNGLSGRVRAFPVALAASEGRVHMPGPDGNSPSQMSRVVNQAGPRTVAVAAESLATFLHRIESPSIDLLKMDIEGSEYETILAAPAEVLSRVKRICIEYHEKDDYRPEQLVRHVTAAGFTMRKDTGDGKYGLLHFTRTQDVPRKSF